MQKVIENAILKITKAIEKNRKDYCEAKGNYKDTGYDRYYNKMQKLDKEYEELKVFLGVDKIEKSNMLESENTRLYAENKELKRFISEAKSLIDYINADYWSDPQVGRLYEKFKNFN